MGNIYILAQSRTGTSKKPVVTLIGKGSEVLDATTSAKKARQKTITQSYSIQLAEVAREKKKPHIEKQAWNAYHCLSKFTFVDGKIYGRYCKTRICPICSNNRKADEINKYKPIIETWSNPYFVTLTVKACPKNRLKATIRAMFKAFRNIQDKQIKRESRNGAFHLMGIRSLECNFNPIRSTYNPHFHLIVPDEQTADYLIDSWLERVGVEHSNRKGQYARKVHDTERDLIETIKYGFKLFTDPEMKKNTARNRAKIYVNAQLNIMDAFHKHRIFERFGFNLTKPNIEPSKPQKVSHYEQFEFDLKAYNWINTDTGERFTDYLPDDDLVTVLTNNIDLDRE